MHHGQVSLRVIDDLRAEFTNAKVSPGWELKSTRWVAQSWLDARWHVGGLFKEKTVMKDTPIEEFLAEMAKSEEKWTAWKVGCSHSTPKKWNNASIHTVCITMPVDTDFRLIQPMKTDHNGVWKLLKIYCTIVRSVPEHSLICIFVDDYHRGVPRKKLLAIIPVPRLSCTLVSILTRTVIQ